MHYPKKNAASTDGFNKTNTSGMYKSQSNVAVESEEKQKGKGVPKLDKSKGKSSMFKSQTRDEIKTLKGYYRPTYEEDF